MNIVDLLREELGVKAVIKTALKLLLKVGWNIIKPYAVSAYSHPKLFPLHFYLAFKVDKVYSLAAKYKWGEALGVKKLSVEGQKAWDKTMMLLSILIIVSDKRTKLKPLSLYQSLSVVEPIAGI